jgi:nucleotide-binding universal stress UspA family protein
LGEARTLAEALSAEVILLRVILPVELIEEFGVTIPVTDPAEIRKERALAYLNSIRQRPEWKSIKTSSVVEMGSPAEVILDTCEKTGIDRIVMASHGQTGLKRWALGSVADKVLHAAESTVILVRAGKGASKETGFIS